MTAPRPFALRLRHAARMGKRYRPRLKLHPLPPMLDLLALQDTIRKEVVDACCLPSGFWLEYGGRGRR